jgi:branched-chain amino acid transport system permease protein
LPQVLKTFLSTTAASTAAPAMASMLIYVLMAALLVWRPTGLFGARN